MEGLVVDNTMITFHFIMVRAHSPNVCFTATWLTVFANYTTSIIYNLNFLCYDDDCIGKISGDVVRSGKERDMAALTRRYSFYSEYLKAQLDERELGLCFMHSSVDKLIRGNDVYDKGLRS